MKILVAIKRVIDPYAKIRVKPDGSGVETNGVKMAVNPFDEIALEEALRLKEKGLASEVVVVSIGDSKVQETLRSGLALGADRAIWVEVNEELEPLNIAKCLAAITQQESPQLVFLGKQGIDGDNNQVGQMLAGLLNWPQATFASEIALENNQLTVKREIDGGLETLNLALPAVVTTDLRLNEPRYASLPNIMKAKQKPLATKTLADLNLQLKPHLKTLKVSPPKTRGQGVMVTSVSELVDKLRNEAKVI